MIDLPSPNCDARPCADGIAFNTLILHYTGMQTAQAAIDRLRDPEAKVSSHYVVDEDGTIYCLVPEEMRAYHAGISYWRGRRALNDVSIGIEIVNPGHEFGYRAFPQAQMDAVRELCLGILARHEIPPINVIAHSDIAPNRKQDPGEYFDWQNLAKAGIGIFPDGLIEAGASTEISQGSDRIAAKLLAQIGFEIDPQNFTSETLKIALIAFQRHWRQFNIAGLPDQGTLKALEIIRNSMGERNATHHFGPPQSNP